MRISSSYCADWICFGYHPADQVGTAAAADRFGWVESVRSLLAEGAGFQCASDGRVVADGCFCPSTRRQGSDKMEVERTVGGVRLSLHGVVISEVRDQPGPTHSVFDVLSALMVILYGGGRVGLLGFAGGGMMAPLRRLDFRGRVEGVDLDRRGIEVFLERCGRWAGDFDWHHGDAIGWLEAQGEQQFGLIVEDLSVPARDDVFKPDVSWGSLPSLVRSRLSRGGFGIFNLLPAEDGEFPEQLHCFGFPGVEPVRVEFDHYCNRILIVGRQLPTARTMGAMLGVQLRSLRSEQAGRVHVRTGVGRC